MVQRCGRAGRKRTGRVVMLVADNYSGTGDTEQQPRNESNKVALAEEGISRVDRILAHAAQTLRLHQQHNARMFPKNWPLPTMVLQNVGPSTLPQAKQNQLFLNEHASSTEDDRCVMNERLASLEEIGHSVPPRRTLKEMGSIIAKSFAVTDGAAAVGSMASSSVLK
jgi:hypothetical protein